ncbi:uncharacterized protein LOC134543216 [Bacillus rossius redtenbacheri]|uniref:uncharacterized protein LOC134543216 n=1 Tax=Bacillus rossius redtenbacheri TaxID=93214 RepID=UPI002FDE2AA7
MIFERPQKAREARESDRGAPLISGQAGPSAPIAVDRSSPTTMMKLVLTVLLLVALARAHPRFLAIPLDGVDVVEVAEPLGAPGWQVVELVPGPSRVAREAPGASEEAGRVQRGAHHHDDGHGHDYVDYGAHTGHHGAYGWYADFPVIKH